MPTWPWDETLSTIALFFFDFYDLFHPPCMSAITEWCLKEDLDDLPNLVFAQKIRPEA